MPTYGWLPPRSVFGATCSSEAEALPAALPEVSRAELSALRGGAWGSPAASTVAGYAISIFIADRGFRHVRSPNIHLKAAGDKRCEANLFAAYGWYHGPHGPPGALRRQEPWGAKSHPRLPQVSSLRCRRRTPAMREDGFLRQGSSLRRGGKVTKWSLAPYNYNRKTWSDDRARYWTFRLADRQRRNDAEQRPEASGGNPLP